MVWAVDVYGSASGDSRREINRWAYAAIFTPVTPQTKPYEFKADIDLLKRQLWIKGKFTW